MIVDRLSAGVFRLRPAVLVLFALLTLLMGWSAAQLRIDAGFEKQLPTDHPYMETFLEHRAEFGGANRILVAVRATDGDMFTPEFFETLREVTDAVFFLPGVDRARVQSIFTPNVRFTEIVEGGFAGGTVVPAEFQPTPEFLSLVRENILKSGQVGRLVADDFSAAIVAAQLLERDPQTGERIDFIEVGQLLEDTIREPFETDAIKIHIIGFSKVVHDIATGAAGVVLFFGVAFLITAVLVYVFCRSLRLTGTALLASLVAVVWQVGLLNLLGFGIDPLSILVPFLIFAIGVSHGVQMVNGVRSAIFDGATTRDAAEQAFQRLLVPGGVALLSDTIGFLTILLIPIPAIRELAITASLGVAVIILTNLVLLPVLLSYLNLDRKFSRDLHVQADHRQPVWAFLARFTRLHYAVPTVLVAALLYGWGAWESRNLPIGDLQAGVPELRPDSRYNQDTAQIVQRFAIGVDVISVIAEAPADACIDHAAVDQIDRFDWHMANTDGVQSTLALPQVMKRINAGWNEGNPAWQELARNQFVLVRSVRSVETATGLLNEDCSVMPILVFTQDHKAETIAHIVETVKTYRDSHDTTPVTFRLATGNVGVMAATNEVVSDQQLPILLWVYGAVVVLCLITFRSVRATLCTVLPLTLVSVLAYALMSQMQIGLKVSTLPVAALGVGIGVDYGIYIFSRLRQYLNAGMALESAYLQTLKETGSAVVFTGVTLAIGVSTWVFSALQFQADMGLLLVFFFLVNMLGAVILLPALAALIGAVVPWRRQGPVAAG